VRNSDSRSSLVWLFVGLGFVAGGLKMGIGPLNAPGPGFFPVLVGGVFSLLSMALFMSTFLAKDQLSERRSFWKEKKSCRKVSLSLLSLVFYLISLNYLGYLITTFLFILFLLKFVGQRKWGPSILIAILVSWGSYAIFKTGLGVALPKGLIQI
jgi:putative tricarboxylic transport membrane protein